jgi:alpha-tubulin suppressor-like RCC1 family protein
MPNQFLSDEFGDIEDYFVTDYWLIDQFVGDQLWVWGAGGFGQLGINNTASSVVTPVTTFAGGTTWKQVATGWLHTAAIKTDGTLWTWGRNANGQLGINNTDNRSTPVTTFAGGNNWKQVVCGDTHTAAIKTDGTLWTWGYGDFGRLGNNSFGSSNVPVTTFAGGNNWKQVSMSVKCRHTAAIKTDGTLWSWGTTVGDNFFTFRITPVTTFAGGNTWKQVSVGYDRTAAIKTDGTLWVWGNNGSGQLGTNDITTRNTPVTTFAGGNDWKQVACGNNNIAAIKTDGSLWNWGFDNGGQLGTGNNTTRSTPVTTFAGGNNWKQVSCGDVHIMAIKTDGTLWVWGRNDFDALGRGGGGNQNTPVITFAGGNNWKQVSAGHLYSAAIKSGLNVDLS